MRYPVTPATGLLGLALLVWFAPSLFGNQRPPTNETSVTPAVILPEHPPCIAATPEELARVRAAWYEPGPAGDLVRARVARAGKALAEDVVFPPRGGQHNQWYQCDVDQIALVTLDATRHQCPKCKKVFTGEPYDDVVFTRVHSRNLDRMYESAWAYAITGETRYADDAKRILLGYSERYRQYPYHNASRDDTRQRRVGGGHLFAQTLDEASAMITTIAPSVDLLDPALTSEELKAVRDGLLAPILQNIDKNKRGKSNWQTWHNAALFSGGILVGDAQMAQRSIDDQNNGFLFQMSACVTEDGMWYENSWSYHAYALRALVAHAEAARRCGVDLWSQPPLRKMILLPAAYTMADGSLPRFGDAVGRAPGVHPEQVEAAIAATHDERLSVLAPARVSWESILYGRDVRNAAAKSPVGSAVFPDSGHAILRTGGGAKLTSACTFGPYGGFHGHYDKLSFVFFGYGQELGVDPGRAQSQAYGLPIHSNWYKATISHNAVVVDGASQAPAAGKLLTFASNAHYAAVFAACDAAYPGVTQRRLLVQTPDYLLVVDDLKADTARRFDWIYHNRGGGVVCEAAKTDAGPEADYPGQEYMERIKTGSTDRMVRAVFAGNDVTTEVLAAAAPGTVVRIADGPAESVTSRVPLVMFTRTGTTARFAVVIAPVQTGATRGVDEVELIDRRGTLEIRVRGKVQDVVTLTPGNRLTVRHGGGTVLKN